MHRILLSTVAVLALGTTGAFANSALIGQVGFGFPQWAHIDQSSHHTYKDNAVIVQVGGLQGANIDQHSHTNHNNAGILQVGAFNHANIDQASHTSHDNAAIAQIGFGNSAHIDQDSSHDTAVIVQVGAGNHASINQ